MNKNIIGIRIGNMGKIYYFDSNKIDLSIGDNVIVETQKGIEYGKVVIKKDKLDMLNLKNYTLKKIIRKANYSDNEQIKKNKFDKKKIFEICIKNIKKHKLSMKLLDLKYTFNRDKIIFYFKADQRVDFRELVKDLAYFFKTRIELKQVGVRDEAKFICGNGSCGRKLCCCSFLDEFNVVSIKMAKNQNLSLNPSKISGVCGRLKCCLKYEDENYVELKSKFPKEGDIVLSPNGECKIIKNYLFKNESIVEFKDGGISKFSINDLKFTPAGYQEVNFTKEDENVLKEEGQDFLNDEII